MTRYQVRFHINRAYYSIFYAIKAVNALDRFDSSKHSDVIAHFNQEYVKNGIFPKDLSKSYVWRLKIERKRIYGLISGENGV